MKFRWLYLFAYVVSLICASNFLTGCSAAPDIPTQGEIKYVSTESKTTEFIKLAPPNSAGISINTFANFTVNRPLVISNTLEAYGAGATRTARTIVIQSNDMAIKNNIEIIGATADLVLVSPASNTTLSCQSCSFANINRLTLAAASFSTPLNSTSSVLGNLVTNATSTVSIDSLNAAGLSSLELIGYNIKNTGTINTLLRAKRSPDGGYTADPSGGLVVGSGVVSLYPRKVSIDYETLNIKSITSENSEYQLGGTIKAAVIQIKAATPLELIGTLDTRSDLLSASMRNQKISALSEGIKITTLANKDTSLQGRIAIKGSLETDANLTIESSGGLSIYGALGGKDIEFIVANKLLNQAGSTVTAKKTLTIAADQLENNGIFEGDKLDFSALGDIQNRFGGRILGDVIELKSENGLIRNGSTYPYLPRTETAFIYNDYTGDTLSQNNILSTTNSFTFDPAKHIKKNDLSAKIIGGSVKLDAGGNIENINPYFELRENNVWESGITFDFEKAERVTILGQKNLSLNVRSSNGRLLNSSAILATTSSSAPLVDNAEQDFGFKVYAPLVVNERYLARAITDSFDESSQKGQQLALKIYSPPGIIYSFSRLHWKFTGKYKDSFINNASYFELFDTAKFAIETSLHDKYTIKNMGLMMVRETKELTTLVTTRHSQCLAFSVGYESRCPEQTVSVTSAVNINQENEQQTLFSVKELEAPKFSLNASTRNVMADIRATAEAAALANNPYKADHYGNLQVSVGAYFDADHTNLIFYMNHFWNDPDCGGDSRCLSEKHKDEPLPPNLPTISVPVAQIITDAFAKLKQAVLADITAIKLWISSIGA
jgi:hypothetical protein